MQIKPTAIVNTSPNELPESDQCACAVSLPRVFKILALSAEVTLLICAIFVQLMLFGAEELADWRGSRRKQLQDMAFSLFSRLYV